MKMMCIYIYSGDYGLARGGSNTNYPYNGADNSPISYDNKIHVSEIYGNSKFLLLLITIIFEMFFFSLSL